MTQSRLVPLAVLFVAGLITMHAAFVAASRDVNAAENEAARHREEARRLPLGDFTRDWFNRVHGRVVSAAGVPLGGVQVKMFDSAALEESVRGAGPGEWPLPEPEATTFTGSRGEYQFLHLKYGAKSLVFSHPDYRTSTVSDALLLDGTGLEFNTVLVETGVYRLRLVEEDGEPAVDLSVILLPTVWGVQSKKTRTDADGWLNVPADLWANERDGELLAGEPSVFTKVKLQPFQVELALPTRHDLHIALEGAECQDAIEIEVFPAHALRCGHRTFELVPENNGIRIEGVREGSFGVLARQGNTAAWCWVDHPESSARLVFYPLRRVLVELTHELNGKLVPVSGRGVHWEPDPEMPRPMLPTTPREWFDVASFPTTGAVTDLEGKAELEGCAGSGYLTVHADKGHGSVRQRVSATEDLVPIVLPSAHQVHVRGVRPFVPIVVTQNGVAELIRSDMYSDVSTWALHGPLTAVSGLPNGGSTYPRGMWVGLGKQQIVFTQLDEAAPEKLCVFGFVVSLHDGPRAGARVWAHSVDIEGRWYSTTDENGFYRIAGIEPGTHRVSMVDEEGRESPHQWLESASGYVRLDLTAWPALLEVSAMPADGTLVMIPEEGRIVWSSDVAKGEEVQLCSVAPGRYRFEGTFENMAVVRTDLVTVPAESVAIRVALDAAAAMPQAEPAVEK